MSSKDMTTQGVFLNATAGNRVYLNRARSSEQLSSYPSLSFLCENKTAKITSLINSLRGFISSFERNLRQNEYGFQ